ncbi:sigma-70 family RNA polymerase sigma factor [Parablautia intestinalis]|uniref:Sigma-70 family RNA polymerase sigma factor n=1 Tax=Parablautia intestinalis TaxID=2320100 RepID=A0A3A9AUZ9_9FIRM|nr:sigma-70 family RNA polymerase sigma factor [Parablautia intestinalis]MCI8613854.1 sigma-70 family RNA polymerase sigma factor [Lachnospiraceae bacterium]RKI91381.1 sigma-70 family RNA polymerase sigma factor [Parablautia intestinalis]
MEDTLVKKAQKGDPDSFVRLMELNKNSMQRIAYGFFHEEEDVADVIQDTVLLAFEHIREVRKTEYFKSWLMRILINNCRRLYNSQKRVQPQELTGKEEGKRDFYPSDNDFFRMLSVLPSDSRVIFQLFYGEQFTTKEISRLLQMNESTIRSKLHRGKDQLRSSWEMEV